MKRILAVALLLFLLASPSPARADVAPPARPPGSSLQPGEETTQVRMVAESVHIEVQPGHSDKSLGQAQVTADFTLHNLGTANENMAARFPVAASDGFFAVNEIRDLRVEVDGRNVATRSIMGEDPYNGSEPVPWAEFDVAFPAGQDKSIEVRYTLDAAGEYPFIWFKYILSTGAGWKGSIGSADLTVSLPYEANHQNVLLGGASSWSGTSPGATLAGNTIRWHYADLEPTAQDNFEVNLVMPAAWQSLLAEQRNVTQNPRDGEAWGRLGKLSKEFAFSSRGKGFRSSDTLDLGGEELYQQSLQAYEHATTLLPDDALWHAGYANLLAYHAYFEAFNGTDTSAEAVHSLQEIHTALQLNPIDPKVQQIAEQIAGSFPDGMQWTGNTFSFPWLTATPTALVAVLPTGTPATAISTTEAQPQNASPTGSVPATAQEIPPSATKPGSPLCGSVIMIPIVLAALIILHPGRRAHSQAIVDEYKTP
jgi:hypothetical protein